MVKRGPLVVLTGAGISEESGLKTFRGAAGLWEEQRLEDVAHPEAFERDPALVHRFYNARRAQLLSAAIEANAAHRALARLQQAWPDEFTLVTQNVDDLHERAGSQGLLHMHGELLRARCRSSGEDLIWTEPLSVDLPCPRCGEKGCLRPHVVWFGEQPLHLPQIEAALARAKIFLVIGTSGEVYPAAGFVGWVPPDCHKIEINTNETRISRAFDEKLTGRASVQVPALVGKLLAGR